MKPFILVVLAASLLSSCAVHTREQQKEQDKFIYEWAIYRESTIVLYAKVHNISKEEAKKRVVPFVEHEAERLTNEHPL